jgi:hypothetical protein
MRLSLEDFAARCLWLEHIRLRQYISEFEAQKHFKKTLRRVKRGDLGLEPRTEWTAMVERWYRQEYKGII